MKNLTKEQLVTIFIILVLLLILPLAIYLTRKQQEIRPKANIAGQANLHLSTSNLSPNIGDTITASVSMELSTSGLRASGVDFRLLYDKNLFAPQPGITPAAGAGMPFTDVVYSAEDQPWDNTYNALRLVMVNRASNLSLAGGANIPLAWVQFKTLASGAAVIKFPDNNQDNNGVDLLQVGGIDLGGGPTNTPGPGTPTPTLGAGLVSYWTMDESSGSQVGDSVDGNTGTAHGATIVSGKSGNARSFNGTSDYVEIGDSDSLSPSAISVSAWINLKSLPLNTVLVIVGKNNSEWELGVDTGVTCNNKKTIYVYIKGGSALCGNTTMEAGVWTHVVLTYDGHTVSEYVNGTLDKQYTSTSGIPNGVNPVDFGRRSKDNDYYFPGIIDSVRLYNRVLTASEVSQLYQSGQ